MGNGVPKAGEAQVGTIFTRSRVVSGADQNHQVHLRFRWQPHSPSPCEALVGTRVTRYMRSLKHCSHQVHMMSMWERESPVTGEAQVGIRLTMSR